MVKVGRKRIWVDSPVFELAGWISRFARAGFLVLFTRVLSSWVLLFADQNFRGSGEEPRV
jgi:hypothetical protein